MLHIHKIIYDPNRITKGTHKNNIMKLIMQYRILPFESYFVKEKIVSGKANT